MENKYYEMLEKQDGFYELNIYEFNDFIELLRPDNLIIQNLMTKLRYDENLEYIDTPMGRINIPFPVELDSNIIFRGHGDSNWNLTSTFDRSKQSYYFNNFIFKQRREFELLKNFQNSCDLTGVYLPSDSNELRQKQFSRFNNFFGSSSFDGVTMDWFNQDFFELAAFAQHYGVPTRLLDWSKNPFVACYFANSYALEQGYKLENMISIWVLNFEKMDSKLQKALKILDLPKGINQHISHQHGVLSYVELIPEILTLMLNDDGDEMESASLHEILKHFENDYRLLKINLGYEHITRLYKYCNAHNFNACNLFRGAHGAALHTKDLINYENFEFAE